MLCAMVRMSHLMASIAHDGIRAAGGVDLEQEQRSFQTLAGLCAPVARASARVFRSLACRPSPRHPGLHRLDHQPQRWDQRPLRTQRTTRGGPAQAEHRAGDQARGCAGRAQRAQRPPPQRGTAGPAPHATGNCAMPACANWARPYPQASLRSPAMAPPGGRAGGPPAHQATRPQPASLPSAAAADGCA